MASPSKLPTLPADIEEALATCEKRIEADAKEIQDLVDSLDGEEDWTDPSLVHHVEDLRAALRQTRESIQPATQPVALPLPAPPEQPQK